MHLICSSPSIQIVCPGMTEPVVGDRHRQARTMRCAGDVGVIMPQESFSLSGYRRVDFSKWFLNVLYLHVKSCSENSAVSFQHVRASVIFLLLFPTPCWHSHEIVCTRLLKLQDVSLHLSLYLSVCFLSILSFSLFFFFFCFSPCWQDPIYQLISAFPGTLPTGNTAGGGVRERE